MQRDADYTRPNQSLCQVIYRRKNDVLRVTDILRKNPRANRAHSPYAFISNALKAYCQFSFVRNIRREIRLPAFRTRPYFIRTEQRGL